MVVSSSPSPAHAQGTEAEASRQSAALTLFQEGRRLLESEQYAEACPKFADSLKLDPGVGTMLNLAFCYEKEGRTASAWSAYLDAAAAARDKGETERERVARARAGLLEAVLPKLTVQVAESTGAEVDVRLDGTRLPPTLWGVPMPVDAAAHDVRAEAPGRLPWSARVDVDSTHPQVVVVPTLEPVPAHEAPSPARVERNDESRPRPSSGAHWQRPAAVAIGGLGVVGIGLGAAFAIAAQGRYDASKAPSECTDRDHCTATGVHDRSLAFTYADVASVATAAGVAGLVTAAVVWFSAPRSKGPPTRLAVGPGSPGSPGTIGRAWTLELRGSW
jgi:serine/threonine-protein kinase